MSYVRADDVLPKELMREPEQQKYPEMNMNYSRIMMRVLLKNMEMI